MISTWTNPFIIKPGRHIRRDGFRVRKRFEHFGRDIVRASVIQRHNGIGHTAQKMCRTHGWHASH